MKKINLIIVTFIMTLIGVSNVSANELKNLDITAYIDEEGNAKVTEVWDMYVDEGTEVYKPMENLGDREITNFKVVDEKGTTYTNISWKDRKSVV